jgi:hypothetical protein
MSHLTAQFFYLEINTVDDINTILTFSKFPVRLFDLTAETESSGSIRKGQ